MGTIKTFALAAGMSLVAMAASAATLDFTNLKTFTTGGASASSSSASGTIGGGVSAVTWTLTPSVTPMKYNFSAASGAPAALQGTDKGFDGTAAGKAALQASSGLKLDGDGIGIRNDEITFGERVTLTFSKAVKITGIHVLDLFFGTHNGEQGFEIANVTGDLITSLTANQRKEVAPNHGYRFGSTDSNGFTVTSLTFRASATNAFGDDGVRDYALAAVDYEIAPIPLPAGGLLLLTALGGLAAARRRKQA